MTARCTCRWERPRSLFVEGWASFRVEADPKCPVHYEPPRYVHPDGSLHTEPYTENVGKHGGCG